MPRPEGYRKALRLMKLAEKFGLPVFTFVDTPGAYPGHRRRGARPVGGDRPQHLRDGAARGADHRHHHRRGRLGRRARDRRRRPLLMLQYSIYSVISPEGCASILWKTAERAAEAAETLGITAHRLKALGLVDEIVSEPVGGAHRDPKQMAAFLKRALADALRQFSDMPAQRTDAATHNRLRATAGSATRPRADDAAPPARASPSPTAAAAIRRAAACDRCGRAARRRRCGAARPSRLER